MVRLLNELNIKQYRYARLVEKEDD